MYDDVYYIGKPLPTDESFDSESFLMGLGYSQREAFDITSGNHED
jgi:hypothetical protein